MPFYARALELMLPSVGDHRFVALLLAAPDEVAGTYEELADSGYERAVQDDWLTVDNGDGRVARVNDGAIVFGALADQAETVIPWWGIFDMDIGGNLIAAGPVLNSDGEAQPLVVAAGNQPRFTSGDLKLLSSCEAPG